MCTYLFVVMFFPLELLWVRICHGPLVPCGVAELVSIGSGEVVEDGWATRSIWVFHGDDLLVVVQVVQERCEDSPRSIQLIVTDEVGMITLERVENQRFVGFGDLKVREAAAISEIEFSNNSLHGETG